MSFITNIFGGGKKKEKKPEAPTSEQIAKQKAMQKEQEAFANAKTLEGLKAQEAKFDQKIDSISVKIKQQEAVRHF